MTTTHRFVDLAALAEHQDLEGDLNWDDPADLLAELTLVAVADGDHSIRSADKTEHLHGLARITMLAGRLAWLASTDLQHEQYKAKLAEQIINQKVAAGELIRTSGPDGRAVLHEVITAERTAP